MKTALLVVATASVWAAELRLLPEHVRVDPFGEVIEADRGGAAAGSAPQLASARAAFVSCRVLVQMPEGGGYKLVVTAPWQSDLYREWFHREASGKRYFPDALIPMSAGGHGQMPDAENRIAGQSTQSYWLDVWVPAEAKPGRHVVEVSLESGAGRKRAEVEILVLEAKVPEQDAVVIDHNSYGTGWFQAQYPQLAAREGDKFYLGDSFFSLIHAYHRVFYEHRGTYHQLGYGHGGKVGPEFAPRLTGSGRNRRVADWTLYDKHYGPLLDGSAFAATRRGARPIPFVYLPVNPEWPASFLWWGEPGYETEFVRVVGEMEAHFRANGWTNTRFELFFNHKKRYKAFPWDGDETRFRHDFPFLAEYRRLLDKAAPAGTPVKFVYRTDVSWQMERQFREQAGVFDFWVCGGGMFGWYAEQLPELKRRGHIVWLYGGTPGVDKPASHITLELMRTWMLGADGFVRWQTVMPGADPWFRFGLGGETLVYPGDRFGRAEPLASIRLKLQRNAMQDLALLDALQGRHGGHALRAEAAQRYNQTEVGDWRAPRPAMASTSPDTWTNADIDDALRKDPRFDERLDAAAWSRVRAYALSLAKEIRP